MSANHPKQIPNHHQPLRPLQIITHGSNPDEVNEMPRHKFHLETSDVSAMSSFMYAMSDLVGEVRLHVTKDQIHVSERIARDNIFVSLTMKSSVFDKYECSGSIVFCFQPKVMYQYISRHQSNYMMIWDLEPGPVSQREKKRMRLDADIDPDALGSNDHFAKKSSTNYFLSVTIKSITNDDESGSCDTFQYFVPLLRSYKQRYKSPEMKMDYLLAIDSNMLTNDILATFSSLQREIMSRYVTIECTPEKISFEMVGTPGSTVSHAKFSSIIAHKNAKPMSSQKRNRRNKKNTNDNNSVTTGIDESLERKQIQSDCVSAQYNLVYLTRLQKCFSTNSGVVYLYVKEGFPLLFDIKVGTLGSLRAVLMFRNEDEDDEYDNITTSVY